MKKIISIIVATIMVFSFTFVSFAGAKNVETINVTPSLTEVLVEGTTTVPVAPEEPVYAAIVQLRDEENNIISMESVPVSDNAFSVDFTGLSLVSGKTYYIYAANYAGGSWKTKDFVVRAQYVPSSVSKISGSTKSSVTFSKNWFMDEKGFWKIKNNKNQLVINAWLCDNEVTANGNNVWYLLGPDGTMITSNLVQDETGNYYSIEDRHNGYYGMLRYKNGYYNCNGQEVYIEFEQSHNGAFGAINNIEAIKKLITIFGVTKLNINNSNIVNTNSF